MKTLLFAAATLFVAGTAGAQNIVVNPGLENGGPEWYRSNLGILSWGADGHNSSGFASTGCVSDWCTSTYNQGAYFGQALNTVVGRTYDLSFWLAESGGPTSGYSVFWGGLMVADVLNPNHGPGPANRPGNNWRQFFVNGLVANATTTDLQIHGRHDPAAIQFDDISVVARNAAGPVPEPATWALMMAGFGVVGGAMRRRRRIARIIHA